MCIAYNYWTCRFHALRRDSELPKSKHTSNAKIVIHLTLTSNIDREIELKMQELPKHIKFDFFFLSYVEKRNPIHVSSVIQIYVSSVYCLLDILLYGIYVTPWFDPYWQKNKKIELGTLFELTIHTKGLWVWNKTTLGSFDQSILELLSSLSDIDESKEDFEKYLDEQKEISVWVWVSI